jgi:dynein heavy chain
MRNKYRPVAIRGALIYFVIADLALIDPMYQYSLSYFTKLFNTCIDDSEKSTDLNKRLASLLSYLTATVYTNVCRGLFEAHKLLLSFLVSISILRNDAVVRRGGLLRPRVSARASRVVVVVVVVIVIWPRVNCAVQIFSLV